MNLDGTNLNRFTGDSLMSFYPEWSPDGEKLSYVQGTGKGDYGIYIRNADGTNESRINNSAGDDYDERPVWAPAGDKIAFAAALEEPLIGGGIYVMNSDGSNKQILSDGSSPIWSIDGNRIAFLSGQPRQLFIMNKDGTNKLQLTHDAQGNRYPSWSPVGEKIVFSSQRDGNNEVYVIDADGANLLRLTNDAASDIMPNCSPDGMKIAYISNRGGAADIYKININGTNLVRLTNNSNASYPTWSPDGTKILFFSASGGIYGIGIVNADGTDLQKLTSGFDLYPSWSPVPVK